MQNLKKNKMRKLFFIITLLSLNIHSQKNKIDLSQFTLSNPSSPAFVLVDETSTAIYTPENFKALAIHALDNFGKSLSLEVTPYFLINQKLFHFVTYLDESE